MILSWRITQAGATWAVVAMVPGRDALEAGVVEQTR
jgi:hypothetical protein